MYSLLLDPVNWQTFGIVIGIVAGIAIILTILIVIIYKLCMVKEDERVAKVTDMLAGANCGGCGFAGCADFAKAVVEGKASITDCGPTPNANKAQIAKLLELEYEDEVERFAVVKCAGGNDSKDKFIYLGNEGCVAQSTYVGGKKLCPDGCMGGGTCASICPYHAVTVIDNVSYVDKTVCLTCGLCVKNCPKRLIEFIPKSAKVFIACSSKCKGKEVVSFCKVGCIGCGLCVKTCPNGAITLENNLAVIDYSKCSGCKLCLEKCPRKIIKEV